LSNFIHPQVTEKKQANQLLLQIIAYKLNYDGYQRKASAALQQGVSKRCDALSPQQTVALMYSPHKVRDG